MSHAAMILGVPGLEIERVKRSHGIEVWAQQCPKSARNRRQSTAHQHNPEPCCAPRNRTRL
jgi:hypothetical protein